VRGNQGVGTGAAHFAFPRALTLASVVTFLSLAGHSAASGTLPGLVGLLVVVIVATGLTIVATSRTRSFGWLLGYLLAVQLLIHVFLVLESPHAHSMTPMPLLPSGDMAMSHLVACLVAAVVLARGEQTLDAWSRLLTARLTWHVPVLAIPAGPSTSGVVADSWWPTTSDHACDPRRRGPPLAEGA